MNKANATSLAQFAAYTNPATNQLNYFTIAPGPNATYIISRAVFNPEGAGSLLPSEVVARGSLGTSAACPFGLKVSDSTLVALRDNKTVLLFGTANAALLGPPSLPTVGRRRYLLYEQPVGANPVFRSTDNGDSWSGPIDTDGTDGSPGVQAPHSRPMWQKEYSELSAAETADGSILALVRPSAHLAPVMWFHPCW
jgi:hypothetical protein